MSDPSNQTNTTSQPLADRMRPRDPSEVIGQDATTQPLAEAWAEGKPYSVILWGPPGSGKTSLALALARSSDLRWETLSAVSGGLPELRKVIARAQQAREEGQGTALFIDEIHRWNKAQQDALLPHLESGLVVLIGATTENPQAEVNRALLSRARIYALGRLSAEDLGSLIDGALGDSERGLGEMRLTLTDAARKDLVELSDGDARSALNALERAAIHSGPAAEIDRPQIREAFGANSTPGDEEPFALISALIKSIRGSDLSAALYWLARLEAAGEDPKYVARRLVVLASEDIGLARSQSLIVAVAGAQAVQMVGPPEVWINLAHVTAELARSPKGWDSYQALGRARALVEQSGRPPVPPEIRNPRNKLESQIGYGEGYRHASRDDAEGQEFLPEEIRERARKIFPSED